MSHFDDKSLFEVLELETMFDPPLTRECQECGIETPHYEVVRFQDKTHIVFCSDMEACSERVRAKEDPRDTRDY
jgi:hypothetical protein